MPFNIPESRTLSARFNIDLLAVTTPALVPTPRGERNENRDSSDFILGLHPGMDEETRDEVNLVMFQRGFEWGIHNMKRFCHKVRHEFGGGKLDLWQMNLKFALESWWWPMTTEGWSGWSIDFGFDHPGFVLATLRNPAVAKTMEKVGKSTCHMYAGMFAGVFSVLDRDERGCIELQCYSMGDDCCSFVIGPPATARATEFWLGNGTSAREILEKLKN